ncbi:MAG: dihydropteroate synthase [Rhodospirillales bacterium]|nr:dihydropteroate synthase [Alphaproteobacteria bacterium]MBL6947893.1 dihydropteroate synthase [Rhodospirillales bacterium]
MTAGAFAGLSLDVPRIVGIINVTPDSFSDGGEALAVDDAVRRGRELIEAGADILDIGGESTRPGAKPVGVGQEITRVEPVVRALADEGYTVSIDSRRASVMAAAIEAGAKVINDITALTGDPESLALAAESDLPVILMHMQGDPGTMQGNPQYDDAAKEIFEYLQGRVEACREAGIGRSRIAVDPGIGFGKTLAHNLDILNRLDVYKDLGCPVLLGASRKSFIGHISREEAPKDRVPGSLAAVLSAYARGVRLFRVHDVTETRQALAVWQAIEKN